MRPVRQQEQPSLLPPSSSGNPASRMFPSGACGGAGRKRQVSETLDVERMQIRTAPPSKGPTSMPGRSSRASSECPTSSKASVASLPGGRKARVSTRVVMLGYEERTSFGEDDFVSSRMLYKADCQQLGSCFIANACAPHQ